MAATIQADLFILLMLPHHTAEPAPTTREPTISEPIVRPRRQWRQSMWRWHSARGCLSLIARSTCHRCIPNLLPVDLKDEVGVRRDRGPVIACELTFKLTRPPTCVTKGDQCFLRAGPATDLAKHLPAGGNRGEVFHGDGIGPIVVSAVYDEADPGLHGAAREDLHIAFGRTVPFAKQPKEFGQRMFP